jgi:hypothetical protein
MKPSILFILNLSIANCSRLNLKQEDIPLHSSGAEYLEISGLIVFLLLCICILFALRKATLAKQKEEALEKSLQKSKTRKSGREIPNESKNSSMLSSRTVGITDRRLMKNESMSINNDVSDNTKGCTYRDNDVSFKIDDSEKDDKTDKRGSYPQVLVTAVLPSGDIEPNDRTGKRGSFGQQVIDNEKPNENNVSDDKRDRRGSFAPYGIVNENNEPDDRKDRRGSFAPNVTNVIPSEGMPDLKVAGENSDGVKNGDDNLKSNKSEGRKGSITKNSLIEKYRRKSKNEEIRRKSKGSNNVRFDEQDVVNDTETKYKNNLDV